MELSAAQLASFREEGFLLLRQVLPEAATAPLCREIEERVEAAAREAVAAGQLGAADTFPSAPLETRLALLASACKDPDWIWREAASSIYGKPQSEGMFTLRAAPELLGLAASAVGPEVLAHPQFALRAHLPGAVPSIIPWHQDLACAPPAPPPRPTTLPGCARPLSLTRVWSRWRPDLQPETCSTLIFNAWVPLTDADTANGCLAVQRRSHTAGLLPHETKQELQSVGSKGSRGLSAACTPADDATDVVACEMRVGDVLLLTCGPTCFLRSRLLPL